MNISFIAFFLLILTLFPLKSNASNDKILSLISKDNNYEDVIDELQQRDYDSALEETEELIEEFNKDSDKLNFAKIIKFEILLILERTDDAFLAVNSINEEANLGYRLYKILAFNKYLNANLDIKPLSYDGTKITSWRKEDFRDFIFKNIKLISAKATAETEFTKLERRLFSLPTRPHGIYNSDIEILMYKVSELLMNRNLWTFKELREVTNVLTSKFLQTTIYGQERKKLELKETKHPLINSLIVRKNLENMLWEKDLLSSLIDVRIKITKDAFSKLVDVKGKERLVGLFETLLRDLNLDPQWSLGMYELAKMQLLLNSNTPNVKIIKILNACVKAFPKSIGSKNCEEMIQELKRPSLELITEKFHDFEKNKMKIISKNIEKVYINIVPFSELAFSKAIFRENKRKISKTDILTFLTENKTSTKEVDIPSSMTFYNTETSYTLPNSKKGQYLVAYSQHKNFIEEKKDFHYKVLINSTYFPVLQNNKEDLSIFVFDSSNGSKVSEFKVIFHSFRDIPSKVIENNILKKQDIEEIGRVEVIVGKESLIMNYTDLISSLSPELIDPGYEYFQEKYSVSKKEKIKYMIRAPSGVKKTVKVEIVDEKNKTVLEQNHNFDHKGEVKADFSLPEQSKVGKYSVRLDGFTIRSFSLFEARDDFLVSISEGEKQLTKEKYFTFNIRSKAEEVFGEKKVSIKIVKVTDMKSGSQSRETIAFQESSTNKDGELTVFYRNMSNDKGVENLSTSYLIQISSIVNEKMHVFRKQINGNSKEGVLKLEPLRLGFNSHLTLKCSYVDPKTGLALKGDGKVLIYELENTNKPLERRNTKELVKFFDVNGKNNIAEVERLPHGSYRAIYSIKDDGSEVDKAEFNFTTKNDGKSNGLIFETAINKNILGVRDELLIFGATEFKGKFLHIDILKDNKVVFEHSSDGPVLLKIKPKKQWLGEIQVRVYGLLENNFMSKTYSVHIVKKIKK